MKNTACCELLDPIGISACVLPPVVAVTVTVPALVPPLPAVAVEHLLMPKNVFYVTTGVVPFNVTVSDCER